VVALAHDRGDLFPLLLSGIYAGWVVGAGVQDDDGAWTSGPERSEHAIEIEALGLRGEVRVIGNGKPGIGEDLIVVGPCRAGEVDMWSWSGRVESGEEEGAQVHCTGARDRLD